MDQKISSQSVTRQIQLVFGISIFILFISSIASYYSNQKLIETSMLVDHTNEVLREAENLISQTKDAETGQRAFLITGNPIFIEKFNGTYEEVQAQYEHLREMTADNPVQQQNLLATKLLIDSRFRHMNEIIARANKVNPSERMDFLQGLDNDLLGGKYIMDDLRASVLKIKNEEQRLLQIRTDSQATFIKITPILVIVAAILAILVSILSYVRVKSDLDQRIAKQNKDAEVYNETVRRIAALETTTKKIADGDFTARNNDETDDDLGRISTSLNTMTVSLEKNFNDLKAKNWLQDGAVQLSDAIREELYVKQVGDTVIQLFASYTKGAVGTLYMADDDANLKLTGSYAVTNAPAYILPGEGLAGHVALTKKKIITSEFPADYLKISSATGNTQPVSIVIMPLLYLGDIIGLIEIGYLTPPSDIDIAFLENNAETAAIALNTSRNYEKIQNLLEETQAQSEELQAQHNELENINTELEAQTEKLQASEEELKVQQEELQEANLGLEERTRMLEEKNYEIIEKNQEVQQKAEELAMSTKYKSEFLANMSHELRTPLNSILLLSRLLTENNEENLSKDQVEYAKVIQNSGYGLLSLIDEILDLSKIEAGKMQLEFEEVSLKEIEENCQNLFEPIANEKGIEFKTIIHNTVPDNIETDKLRLEQIIRNLISNALKFTAHGSVTLDIRNHGDKMICFEVRDTGIGIAEEKQKLIFEAFQQEDGSTRRKYGGTGLGLSICRELVKLLGGSIELKSEQGKGSKFFVYIPVNKQAVAIADVKIEIAPVAEQPEEMPTSITGNNGKYIASTIPENIPDDRDIISLDDNSILIVEDDTNFGKSLLEFTRQKGYKGIVAVRGDEAIALAKQYKPKGILLDLQLPVKSGWQVMDELKGNPETRHIPVHMMSSYNAKNEGMLRGAVDFITKPLAFEQMQEIFNKIELVLNQKSKKVLIVEDNPKHAKALAHFLDTFSITSEIKNTIEDSVSAFRKDADCVILDMGIPDQKSYDTLEKIKNEPGLENLPIIIFTGKSLSLSDEQKLKRYADSIVVKTAHSYKRMLDEIALFLHLVELEKPKATDTGVRKYRALQDVLKHKTVLIVDDDVRNIFSLTKSLEALQMNIVTAVNGKEAIAKLEERQDTSIVLLDMMMPEMDGYETARRIRMSPKWKNLPIIAVTAKAMTGDRDKCIKAGASDYISKPVDIDQLVSLLRVWLYDKG